MTDIVLEKLKQFAYDMVCYGKDSVNMNILNDLIEVVDSANCITLKNILIDLEKAIKLDNNFTITEKLSMLDFYF